MLIENDNQNVNDTDNSKINTESENNEHPPKSVKAIEELRNDEREIEQLNVDPEKVIEEQVKRQPQSMEE